MSWSYGFHNGRDIGYGVPAMCDHPGCEAKIHRGLAHVCGGQPYGGETGCGLFFCGDHLVGSFKRDSVGELVLAPHCARCRNRKPPYQFTHDVAEWVEFKETDESWARWRAERDRAREASDAG